MEAEVAFEVGMDDGKMALGIPKCRMHSLHAAVQTKNEVIEIETQTQSVCYGYLAPEGVNLELATGLFGVLAQGPDVSGINKGRAVDFPEKMGTVFCTKVKL